MKNKKSKMHYIAVLAILLFFTGCSVYSPSIQSPITITEKGQIQTDANISFSNELFLRPGFHGSIAYGLSNNSSVQLSMSTKLFDFVNYEISTGNYFINTNFLRLGLFPGYSYGKINYEETNGDIMGARYTDKWSGNYHNVYLNLQSLINLKILTLGIGAKTGLYLPNLTFNNTLVNQRALSTQPTLYIKPNLKWDDTFNFGFSFTFLRLNTLDNFKNYNDLYKEFYDPFVVAFGLTYKFSTKLK